MGRRLVSQDTAQHQSGWETRAQFHSQTGQRLLRGQRNHTHRRQLPQQEGRILQLWILPELHERPQAPNREGVPQSWKGMRVEKEIGFLGRPELKREKLIVISIVIERVKAGMLRLKSEGSGVGDGNLGLGLALAGADPAHGFDHVLAFDNISEDGVLAVEPGAGHEGDEELGAVGVGTSVGH